jgi:hypothetical protein
MLTGSADVRVDEGGNCMTENVLSCELELVDVPAVNGVISIFADEGSMLVKNPSVIRGPSGILAVNGD